ncbi:MAG: RnfABCDGE type electron transport complex subunit D [Flavobacteriales bacterium]|nr:RnfABCDGE type electron transport complex subunit D [Flavobacteriales bacterium]
MRFLQPITATLVFLKQDARHFQIVFLAGFLLFGILQLHWDAELTRYVFLLGTCLGVQACFIRWKSLPWSSLKSAAVSALGMCLLLKAAGPGALVLGAVVAIASKFMLRVNGRHVFNPGNLGIAAAVLLTGDAWVSPGQWGSGVALFFLVTAAGCMVVLRVGRIDTSLAFLGTLAVLEYFRTVLYLGWEMDVWLHRLSNGSLLLFAFFMITDPMTTPRAQRMRVIWSVAIAVLTFLLGWFFWINSAPIWALLIISTITPILDHLQHGDAFRWNTERPEQPAHHEQHQLT